MACDNPTGTTPGILIACDSTDNGVRPLAANTVFWASPNIRLALTTDVQALTNPAAWDNSPWNGQVNQNSAYNLLVRVSNTDTSQQRADLQLQGWISYPTVSGVGPASELLVNPNLPQSATNTPVTFTGFALGPLGVANDPTSTLVIVSNETWTPNSDQYSYQGYNGHVCAIANVYAPATTGDISTPADGQPVTSASPNQYLDPTCDRMFGQRNVQILAAPQGQQIRMPVLLFNPAIARQPLRATVAIRPVQLKEVGGGGLLDVPELARAARDLAITQLQRPVNDPCQDVQWDPDLPVNGDPDPLLRKVVLEPGQQMHLKVDLGAQNHRPGDAHALDVVSTDTATGRVIGGVRAYVLVTD